jgi:enamine deaminase RidA (YjgF/YER057c/UK114 family)
MTQRRYVTDGAGLPELTSPISHAVVVGDHCYVSGQLSVSASGAPVLGTAHEESERAFDNFLRVIQAAGFATSDVVFIDLAFADLADLAAVNDVYAAIFPEGRWPARTVSQAAALPWGCRIKVAGVAVRECT